jgi:hypothetical protein
MPIAISLTLPAERCRHFAVATPMFSAIAAATPLFFACDTPAAADYFDFSYAFRSAARLIAAAIAATPPCHPLMIAMPPITPAAAIIAAFSHFRRQLMASSPS